MVETLYTPKSDFDLIVGIMSKITAKNANSIFYFFGGFVRDHLRGEKPKDIDVYMSSRQDIQEFVTFLRDSDRLRMMDPNPSRSYGLIKLVYVNSMMEEVKMDIVWSPTFPLNGACDFTCNNLVMDTSGRLSTRVPAPKSIFGNVTQVEWLSICVRDAVAGKLVWMGENNPVMSIKYKLKIKTRIQKMLQRGYTIGTLPLEMQRFRSHKELVKTLEEDVHSCPICHEEYTQDAMTVLLGCNHHYHVDCLAQWADTGIYDTCPMCRKPISL